MTTIGELVTVADVETVVRLDGTGSRLSELVLTGDVRHSLAAVVQAATGSAGAGFFVVGPFGCGKSHFLAAVGELLADPTGALAAGARPSAVVAVPLVEYRAKAALEDVVAERAWRSLGQPRPVTGSDRPAAWDRVLAAAGRDGLVLLLDELSEFLRAKQGPALTEDLRFLQFLGEWTADRPVVVLAALQENIEEVANVSQRELARIRDRYRPSLTLSMRHVEDLVHGRLVQLTDGAEPWVDRAWQAFPSGVTRERFGRCYPLHPDTLTVLEGLRFLLSQQRGVVDFISHRLRDCLNRDYRDLITPDEVFDHFRGRLHERVETSRLADTVVPYYERAAGELVDDEDRPLAIRTVKLLSLLAASPLERPRTAPELAAMLLVRASALDPSANAAYLEQAILEPLISRGAYVVGKGGPPRAYCVVLDADAAVVARTLAEQARSELSPGDRRLVATLVELGSTPNLPLQLLAEVGLSRRDIMWHNTLRALTVGTARFLELTVEEAVEAVARARTAGAEGCLFIGEIELGETAAAGQRAAALAAATDRLVAWVPDALDAGERDALLSIHSRRLVLEMARGEGRADVVAVVERAADADAAVAREMLRRAYFQGHVCYPDPNAGRADLPSLSGLGFERQLASLADPLLAALHPLHRDVMPRGELVGERLVRQLLADVVAPGRLGPAAVARGQLRSMIQGYLVPLGLAKLRNDGVTMSPDPARSPAVAEALRLAGSGSAGDSVPAADVARGLADGPLGLTNPEIILVLNACVQAGLLEMRRGRKVFSEPFLAVTGPDRLGSGELVPPSVRSAVAVMTGITGPGPFDPWSSATQRQAWAAAQSWLDARREDLVQVHAGMARLADVAALAAADPGPVLDDVALVSAVVEACPTDRPAPDGLRRLAVAVVDVVAVAALGAAARRLGSVARFLRDDLRRAEEAALYLTHPELTIPDPADEPLRTRRDAALALLASALRLAAEDRVGELFAGYREFRTAYQAAYQAAHDRYYSAVSPNDLLAVRGTAAYRALAGLSAVGATGVPDDQIRVDRLLAGAAPPPCRARLDYELQWRPRCSCRFALGDREPALDQAAALDMAARGVRQHLVELGRPEHRGRLEDAVGDLTSLGRAELAADLSRLVAALALEGEPDLGALAALLDGDLPAVVRDVLTGGQLINTRDLATLREDLIGRRSTKRRLLELLAEWVDPGGDLGGTSYVEVMDSSDPSVAGPPPSTSATTTFLARRFPGVAGMLPAHEPADAFWLAAWWAGRPSPPSWLPAGLVADPARLTAASTAALSDPGAMAELADLDRRIGPETVLGDRVATALDVPGLTAKEVAGLLAGERLLRYPIRLAAEQFLRRLTADWQLAALVDELGAGHALLTHADVAPLTLLVEAARHLAALERNPSPESCQSLVEDLYPVHYAPVSSLISRAGLAAAHGGVVAAETVEEFRAVASRVLRTMDAEFVTHAATDYAGCLRIWEVGDVIVAPLLEQYDRVAVLLVDAMRVDLALPVTALIAETLPRRPVERRWAVVPAPTRTAESVAAMHLGRPVPAGSAPDRPDVPFANLGYQATALVGADRDDRTAELRALWASGPPISVAVATGVDERLHRTSVELAALLDESVLALRRRVIPSLTALPDHVPLVVLADHGFRENARWGHGPEGRYVHGGTSLEECVIPVLVWSPPLGDSRSR